LLHVTRFESDPPNKPEGRRSRIGDRIALLDGQELMNKLKDFDENHRFPISPGLRCKHSK
jgi:hypothetical protein